MRKPNSIQDLKRNLLRIFLAERSLQRARAICSHVLVSDPLHPELYRVFVSMIVVEYARPFSAGKRSKIGNLPSAFAKFSTPERKAFHLRVLEERNDAHAHFSEERQILLFAVKNLARRQIVLYGLREEIFTHDDLRMIAGMCEDLLKRLAKARREALKRLFDNQALAPGHYKLCLQTGDLLTPVDSQEVAGIACDVFSIGGDAKLERI